MSSRALRRLRGSSRQELPDTGNANSSPEDEPEEESPCQQPVTSRFGLLCSDDEAADEHDDNDDRIEPQTAPSDASVVSGNGTKKAKQANKKKRKKSQARTDPDPADDLDDIDSALRAINGDGGVVAAAPSLPQPVATVTHKNVLAVQYRFLNYLNELKKCFGSKVVQSKGVRRAAGSARCYKRPIHLTIPEEEWWHMEKSGMSMIPTQVIGRNQYFVFEHGREYQKVQALFWEAVESLDHENLLAILNNHAYHVDSLLQLSDVCRLGDESQMAASFIARSLFVMEMAFHPHFNLISGDCRLDYRHWENRGFFLALFRHIRVTQSRGCPRTALEFCKVLLSLDPEGDPLCVLLLIDMYALHSKEYGFLVELFDEWNAERNLSKLPNFAYSVPLALYNLSCARGNQEPDDLGLRSRADDMLRSALIMFPGLLMMLLDKINVNPSFDAASEKLFGASAQLRQPVALRQLMSLYVDRCHEFWKPAAVVQWLEGSVAKLVKESADAAVVAQIASAARTRDACFNRSAPVNVYRHLVMSEVTPVLIPLPPDYVNVPVVSYDPLPPKDSVQSYKRLERRLRVENQSMLSAFFSSLMPNFNVQEPVAQDAEGAAAAAAPQNLREGVDALMQAMRNMLRGIEVAPPPREDQEGDNVPDDQEWD